MKQFLCKKVIAVFFSILGYVSVLAQGTQVSFGSIPKSGTALVYSHLDDDLIWMLPFWKITEKFIGGAMPSTPWYDEIIHEQQAYLNANGYSISYESNWFTPWAEITDQEYSEYYLNNNPAYSYLVLDHLETRMYNDPNEMSTFEINKLKAKIEQYIASPDVSRIITHNNWGEYGHKHHKAVNKAVRELAVKYRKDVWMLGCDNERFIDVAIPNGITYAMGSFNDPTLYNSIRNIYEINYRWTWYTDRTPSGDHEFIKIVEAGVDKSNILTGESVTFSGPTQNQPGAYIFDGNDDYLTLNGNNDASFTIAMWVRPDQIRSMDISKMTEYPSNSNSDRNFYLNSDGRVNARIFDGTSKVVTSTSALTAGTWSHIVMTSNGSSLKIYVNGNLENTISAGTASTGYASPEFVLGQTAQTSSYFSGQINDVRLFNYALSDNEVATLSGIVYTIIASAGTGGNINPTGAATVIVGANKTYTITPNNGYYISDVKVDNNSIGAVSTYTFNHVTSDHTISATFTPVTFLITAAAGQGGTISPSGDISVNSGTNRTFTIAPNNGFKITNVKVDNNSVGTVSSYTFSNVTANHTISATFAPLVTYTITSSAGPGGSINPIGILTVGGGTNQTYVFTSDIGYSIAEVMIDGIPSGAIATYTFNNVTSNHTISATFSIITYTITGTAGTGGTINPQAAVIVNYGTNRTFTITTNIGYNISDVLIDDVSVGPVSSYIFNNVRANHTIFAEFTPITFTITSTAGANGSISPGGALTVDYGTGQTFSINPVYGFQVSDVRVDNNSIGAVSSYTFNNVLANHTISATFSIFTYKITASAGTGGSITPSGVVTLDYGMSRTYTITPAIGFQISDLKVDNISVDPVSSYTFNNVIVSHTISVTFSLLTYTIRGDVVKGEEGSISPAGQVKVNYGTNQTYTIIPKTGYKISDIIVDNISMGALSSYTFRNVTTDHTISAKFTPITFTITGIAGSNGSISTAGVSTVNYGTNQLYTITPDIGYQIAEVFIDGTSAGVPLSYTFNNITNNHTISATFTRTIYMVEGTAGAGGSISPAGAQTMYYGSNQAYTITPDNNYKILDVKVDNISLGPVSSYTFNTVTANHTISATFKPFNTYLITATAGTGGTISPSGTINLFEGMNQSYTITPGKGYRISDVKIDNIPVGVLSDYTFNNLMSDHIISATFTTKIEVNLYPNPFKDHIKIIIVSPEEEFFDISIVDLAQKVVFTKTKIPGNAETVIYLQHTPPGIYILKLYTKENRMTTFRIVKY